MDSGSILIPVRGSNEKVEVFCDELPEDVADVIDILKAEIAPLDIWLQFAVEYYRQGREEHFRSILSEVVDALGPEAEQFYQDDLEAYKVGRLRILNALAADAIKRASENPRMEDRKEDELYTQALDYFSQADRIDQMCEMTWVGKGVMLLSQGHMERAAYYFDNAIKSGKNLPAILGKAAICFHAGQYAQALDLYGQALRMSPSRCGAGVRVGLGLCAYKLGQEDRAKAAMERALQVDDQCVEALVGLALLEMGSVDRKKNPSLAAQKIDAAIGMVSEAYRHDQRNAMALNHLANHYFWRWRQISESAEVVTNTSEIHVADSDNLSLNAGDPLRISCLKGNPPTMIVGVVERSEGHGKGKGSTIHLRSAYNGPTYKGVTLAVKDYARVYQLANSGFHNTDNNQMKAESCYLMARVHHAKDDHERAFRYYFEACKLWSGLAPAQYGLAQEYLRLGDRARAQACLEAVLKDQPNHLESLLLLGVLHQQDGESRLALEKLRSALESNPALQEALIAQGQLLQDQASEVQQALTTYKKALEVLEATPGASDEQSIIAILHNVGVLHEQAAELDKAYRATKDALKRSLSTKPIPDDQRIPITEEANSIFWEWDNVGGARVEHQAHAYEITVKQGTKQLRKRARRGQAIRVGPTDGPHFMTTVKGWQGDTVMETTDRLPPMSVMKDQVEYPICIKKSIRFLTRECVPTVFNLALLHQRSGRHQAAAELHNAILATHPAYLASYLKLGHLAQEAGRADEAATWFRQALSVSPNNPDALSLLGNLHMEEKEWEPAQRSFEAILKQPELKLDPYAMLALGNIYFSNLDEPAKYEKHLTHAADFYRRILGVDANNLYASNGLGTVLAEKGLLNQAKDVFARVREASHGELGDVWVNLAHVYLAQNKHNEAIHLYESCLRKFYGGRDWTLCLYLAHAYFDAGRYSECMRTLLKAIRTEPNNMQLWYNLALTCENFAVNVLQKEQKGEHRTLTDVQNAIDNLKGASKLFKWLASIDKLALGYKRLPYNTEKAGKHGTFCHDNIVLAYEHLKHEQLKQKAVQEMRQRQQEAAAEAEKKAKKEKEEAERKKKEEYERRQQLAKVKEMKLENLKEQWNLGVKKKVDDDDDDDDLPQFEDSQVPGDGDEDPSAGGADAEDSNKADATEVGLDWGSGSDDDDSDTELKKEEPKKVAAPPPKAKPKKRQSKGSDEPKKKKRSRLTKKKAKQVKEASDSSGISDNGSDLDMDDISKKSTSALKSMDSDSSGDEGVGASKTKEAPTATSQINFSSSDSSDDDKSSSRPAAAKKKAEAPAPAPSTQTADKVVFSDSSDDELID
eukprot:CAMPEP_0117751552 /NCGR_PEP_ID=MMETSP0947-20121206/11048_1 /TAXON_ID=44440 /ORGANISM="Chattonella subsalsa, Strain CCMP2191" /LENGTH=1322 /DNA_ID=CAMNT_0005569965 /DNA_START=191 /DNA_END=4159 /DNA_ORIENTATION=-